MLKILGVDYSYNYNEVTRDAPKFVSNSSEIVILWCRESKDLLVIAYIVVTGPIDTATGPMS